MMCFWFTSTWTVLVFYVALNGFGVLLRYFAFYDYFECFMCKELNAPREQYDYIVVGSGSAGSIVAQRLSEDENAKVLLIEAGAKGNGMMDIPSLGPFVQNTIYDWQYRTVPQKKACQGLRNKVSHWPMGKIVGGTGMLNNMLYIRGHPDDFWHWYKDKLDFSYYDDILPYFNKAEKYDNKTKMISELPFRSNLSEALLKAAQCAKLPVKEGLEAEHGFYIPKALMMGGGRFTSWHRLSSAKKKNLLIMTNSQVEKVLFKNETEAYGVRYYHLNEFYEATASKGVILSAGVIGTPKILMLSGIGHKRHLQSVKIRSVLDLPVGDNLQDHVTTGFDLVLVDMAPNISMASMLLPCSAIQYFMKGQGPWATTGCEGMTFFSPAGKEVPDLQLMMLPIGVTSDQGAYLRTLVGISDELWQEYFGKINKTAVTILPIVLHPKSRGTVRLKDNNLHSPPVIDPKYLSHNYDVEVLVRGIKEIKKLLDTYPMQQLGAKINDIVFPGCEKYTFDTPNYWECYVRHLTLTSYHPVGTCKLGEVVNYEFQVKGTSKLYVVDGSILPSLPSGNPNAAIMMMAEKASDVIKKQTEKSKNVLLPKK